MDMYVCMYVCMYACMYVCMYVCITSPHLHREYLAEWVPSSPGNTHISELHNSNISWNCSLCTVPILTDDPRRKSVFRYCVCGDLTRISPTIFQKTKEQKALLLFKQMPCQRGEIQCLFVLEIIFVCLLSIAGGIVVKSPFNLGFMQISRAGQIRHDPLYRL